VPTDDPSLSPMQMWCNESQERYVLGVAGAPGRIRRAARASAARSPWSAATAEEHLVVAYGAVPATADAPIDLPMDVLFGKPPKMHRDTAHPPAPRWPALKTGGLDLHDAACACCAPDGGQKNFLVTIGDRSVGGLTARDQMVGPWQVPVADVAITLADFDGYAGEAMAMGERTPLALLDAAASARMAVGEALTNLCAAPVDAGYVKLSANWMAAAGHGRGRAVRRGEGGRHGTVPAAGHQHPGRQGLAVDAGAVARRGRSAQERVAGVAGDLGVRAGRRRAPAADPAARPRRGQRAVADRPRRRQAAPGRFDPGPGACRPRRPAGLRRCRRTWTTRSACAWLLRADPRCAPVGLLLAYHDRSDGGAFAALCEMAFASRLGLDITLDAWGDDPFRSLFNEELGAVVQIAAKTAPRSPIWSSAMH
jgi:phosphoribosylformylglycinamidine synthase